MSQRQLILYSLISLFAIIIIPLFFINIFPTHERLLLNGLLVVIGLPALFYSRYSFQMRSLWLAATSMALVCLALYTAVAIFIKPIALVLSGGLFVYCVATMLLPYWLALMGQQKLVIRYLNALIPRLPMATLIEIRGSTYMLMDEYDKALDDFDAALVRLRGKKKDAQNRRSVIYSHRLAAYLKLRQYDRALEEGDLVVRLMPKEAYGYGQRSVALLYAGNYADAWADVNRAQELIGSNPYWQAILSNTCGLLHYIAGNDDLALTDYECALAFPVHASEAVSIHPIVYCNIASIHLRRGDTAAMQTCYTQGALRNPASIHIRSGQALLDYQLGKVPDAVVLWRGLIAEDSMFADAEEVIHAYFKWTPSLNDTVHQLVAAAQQPAS